MKTVVRIAGAMLLLSLLFSCELQETMSIADRIDAFESDLNAGKYGALQDHFHPDMAGYDTYSDENVLNSGPLSSQNAPFTFTSPSISGTSASGTFSSSGGAEGTYSAVMREDGTDNWKIYSMRIYGSATDYLDIQGLSEPDYFDMRIGLVN